MKLRLFTVMGALLFSGLALATFTANPGTGTATVTVGFADRLVLDLDGDPDTYYSLSQMGSTTSAAVPAGLYSYTASCFGGAEVLGPTNGDCILDVDVPQVTAGPGVYYDTITLNYTTAPNVGGEPGISTPQTIVIPISITVVADPNAVSYAVSATAGPGGSASCSPTSVEVGGSSTCTATPDTGYEFAGWAGDFAGSSATVTIVNIIDDVSLVASFAAESITDVGSSPTPVPAMPMGLLLALSGLLALFGFYRAAK